MRTVGVLFPAGPPQGKKSPLGGQEAHEVRAPWGSFFPPGRPKGKKPPRGAGSARSARTVGAPIYFMPKRPMPFMPPMARIIFAMPPFFICFIMPCICSN
ncbi:hypothetical protein D3C86_1196030 [compost metagenome]